MPGPASLAGLLLSQSHTHPVPKVITQALCGHQRLFDAFTLAGFECDLGQANRFDFQVAAFNRDREYARLLAQLGSLQSDCQGAEADLAGALRLSLKQVMAPDDCFGTPHSLWLEFDVVDPGSLGRAPSLFLALAHPATSEQAVQFTDYLARLTSAAGSVKLPGGLQNLLELLGPGDSISHVGWMLGRATPSLRLVVRVADGTNPLDVGSRLPGERRPGAWAPLLAELSDDLQFNRLCIDVFPDRFEINGIECFPLSGHQRSAALAGILSRLERNEVCTPEHRNRLQDWEGCHFPRPDETWPLAMIWPGLTKPANEFTVFQRSVSHFKVMGRTSGEPLVKAYWGGELTYWSLGSSNVLPNEGAIEAERGHTSQLQHMLDFVRACRNDDALRTSLESELNPSLERLTEAGRQFGFRVEPRSFHQAFAIDWQMRWRQLHEVGALPVETTG